jgi:hypothetical protein
MNLLKGITTKHIFVAQRHVIRESKKKKKKKNNNNNNLYVSYLKLLCFTMERLIKEANINYYDHNEFIDIEEIGGVYKANWKQGGKLVALKSFKLDNDNIEEIAHEVCKFISFRFRFQRIIRTSDTYEYHVTKKIFILFIYLFFYR